MRRVAFTVAVAAAILASCSPAAVETSSGEGPLPIRVQVSGEPEETAVYQAVVKAFEEDNEDIDVELIEIAEKDEHLAKLTTEFAGGDPPDVFLVNFREYSQFVTRGAVEPIGPLLEEEGVDFGAYYEQPLEAFTFDGELQCMPQNISSLVVYYNVALFKQAEVPAPGKGRWDWDAFRATAERLTRDGTHGVGIDPQIIRLAPFVWGNGGEVVDDAAAPTRLTLGTPEAREALEFVVGLARDGLIPSEQELAAQDLETRFVTGKLAMLLSSRRDTPVFREVAGLKWDVGLLPQGDRPAGILHSDGYCLSQGDGPGLEAAARFVAFATGEQGQTITSLGGRTVPALRSVAESPSFLDPTQRPSRSRVFLEGIPHIRRTPVIPTWPEIEDVSEEILLRAFYEHGYTIDDALRDLEDQTRPLFEEGSL